MPSLPDRPVINRSATVACFVTDQECQTIKNGGMPLFTCLFLLPGLSLFCCERSSCRSRQKMQGD